MSGKFILCGIVGWVLINYITLVYVFEAEDLFYQVNCWFYNIFEYFYQNLYFNKFIDFILIFNLLLS